MSELSHAVGDDPRRFFLRYLRQLAGLVECAVVYGESSGEGPEALMDARLAPDMFPFFQQVSTAAGFSLRALFPIASLELPKLGEARSSTDLLELIRWASSMVKELPLESLRGFENRQINTTAGFSDRCFNGREYLYFYAIPNFLFHMSMAYGILRNSGVPLGKSDFDGFHEYPPGFSFT